MGTFHMAKCLQHYIGKYVRGSGIEDAFIETKMLGLKIVEQFWNGTHCVRSLRAISILTDAINRQKWEAYSWHKQI